jgi:hypothetical protein
MVQGLRTGEETLQELEQPSPSCVLPSSHISIRDLCANAGDQVMACRAFALGLLQCPPTCTHTTCPQIDCSKNDSVQATREKVGGTGLAFTRRKHGEAPVVRRVAMEIAADHLAALASVVRILLHAEKACDSRILRNSQQLKGAEAFRSGRVLRNTHGTHAPTLPRVHRKRPSKEAPMRRIPSLKPHSSDVYPTHTRPHACASGHATL